MPYILSNFIKLIDTNLGKPILGNQSNPIASMDMLDPKSQASFATAKGFRLCHFWMHT